MKIRIYFEICSVCNLRCQYCFEKEYVPRYLSAKTVCDFFDRVTLLIDDVVITGGEPMLHPEFYFIVEHIAQVRPLVITTNGTQIDIKRVKKILLLYPNVNIQFSLDAVNREFVDELRGAGTFNKVMENIEQLKNFASQISISTTLTRQREEDIYDIYKFAKENNITLYFPNILPYGALIKNWDLLMPNLEDYISVENTILDIVADDKYESVISNKFDVILNQFLGNEKDEQLYVVKVDAGGHLLTCPATDYNYDCSRIANIIEIADAEELKLLLENHTGCKTAGLLDDECEQCSVEMYCKRVFCGNCVHMISTMPEGAKYICKTFKKHYSNLSKAYKELDGEYDE